MRVLLLIGLLAVVGMCAAAEKKDSPSPIKEGAQETAEQLAKEKSTNLQRRNNRNRLNNGNNRENNGNNRRQMPVVGSIFNGRPSLLGMMSPFGNMNGNFAGYRPGGELKWGNNFGMDNYGGFGGMNQGFGNRAGRFQFDRSGDQNRNPNQNRMRNRNVERNMNNRNNDGGWFGANSDNTIGMNNLNGNNNDNDYDDNNNYDDNDYDNYDNVYDYNTRRNF